MSKSLNINQRSGFTLVEVIIYAAIFGSMISFLSVSIFQLLRGQQSGQGRISVESDVDFLMGKIDWALTGAQAINSPALNATGSAISITRLNFSSNPIVFDTAQKSARIKRGTGAEDFLTGNDVSVDEFTVQHFSQSGSRPEGVTIIITATASSTDSVKASTTISNTFYLNK